MWDWLRDLLCDPEALETGLEELSKTRAKEDDPNRNRLQMLENLIDEEDKKIRRLVTELANHDDDVVLDAIRQEIYRSTKSHEVLKEEQIRLTNELSHYEVTDDQKDYIMAFAAEIAQRLNDASYEEKRHIMDILDVRATLYIGEIDKKHRWLDVTCAITPDNDTIVLHPLYEKYRCPGRLF